MPELLVKKAPKSSERPKTCIIMIIALLLVSSACLSGYVYYLIMIRNTETCSTKECLQATLDLISSMDPTVDPCTDFYQFACGNYLNTVAEDNRHSYVEHVRNNKMRALLEEEINEDEWEVLLLLKRYYQACINTSAIDLNNNKMVYDLLMELGGWPVIEGPRWKNFEIDKAISKCRRLGLPADWYFKIYFNEFENKMEIALPDVNADFDNPFRNSLYLELMVETAVHFGGSKILATREMREVLRFETQLQQIVTTNYNNTHQWTPGELMSTFSYFNIYNLVNSFNYKEKSKIILANIPFLNDLNLLLAGTSRRTLANFFIWKIIEYFGMHLSAPIRDNFVKFRNFHKANASWTEAYHQMCFNDTQQRFPYALHMAYMKRTTEEAAMDDVKEMLTTIKNTYISRIDTANWIDKEAKYKAKNKLKNIFELIGYQNVDNIHFPKIYEFNFTSGNIIEIIREINMDNYYMDNSLEKTMRIDKYSKTIIEATYAANGFYNKNANIIVLGAPLLDEMFFTKNKPNYLNYGSLGTIISRQIAHGFYLDALSYETSLEGTPITDTQTTIEQFNEESDFLWSNRTYDGVYARVTCIDDQFNEFDEMMTDKVLSAENFADVLGAELAYASYNKWLERNHEEPKLPGLPFTPNQMFWLEFATQFCNGKIENDIQIPLRYRVLNPLRNSPSFARDFECKQDSEMNPVDKCFIF